MCRERQQTNDESGEEILEVLLCNKNQPMFNVRESDRKAAFQTVASRTPARKAAYWTAYKGKKKKKKGAR